MNQRKVQGGGGSTRRCLNHSILMIFLLLTLLRIQRTDAVKRASGGKGGGVTSSQASIKSSTTPKPSSSTSSSGGVGDKKKSKAGGAAAAKSGPKGKGATAGSSKGSTGTCTSTDSIIEEVSIDTSATATLSSPSSSSSSSSGGGLTIQLKLQDGTLRRLTLAGSTTPSALRHHLLAQGVISPGEAEGLKLQRVQGSRPVTQGLATASILKDGDVIIAQGGSSASSSSYHHHRHGGAPGFVPYPELARKKKPFSSNSRSRSFTDIELYKVRRQEEAALSMIRVEAGAMGSFTSRVGAGETRIGLLYGRFDNKTKEVRVEAVFEPYKQPQGRRIQDNDDSLLFDESPLIMPPSSSSSSSSSSTSSSTSSSSSASSSSSSSSSNSNSHITASTEVVRAAKVASSLGLVPVGWVVARPGPTPFLSGQEVVLGAKLQAEAMKEGAAGREIGSAFVMLAVNTSSPTSMPSTPPPSRGGKKGATQKKGTSHHSVEAFQVSKQAVQMGWEGLFDTSKPKALRGEIVPTTSEVFVAGSEVKVVDTALFTLPVAIAGHEGGFFKKVSAPLGDDEALRSALGITPESNCRLDTRTKVLLSRLSDFHVLVYLTRYLRTEELEKLCGVVRAFGTTKQSSTAAATGKGGKGKKGTKEKIPNVPPGVRALLEALWDEG